MSLSVTKIFKHSAKFNAIQIIEKLISIPKSIIIAKVLLPQDYGIVSFLALWITYSGLLNLGFLRVAHREIPYFLGKENKKAALKTQNINISADLIYSFLPFLVIFIASFLFSNSVIKIGLRITAFSFFTKCLMNYWRGINLVKQRFSIVAKGDFIQSVSTVVIIVLLIYWLKIYAILIAPIIVSLIMWIYYLKRAPISYRFQIDLKEIKKSLKVGIIIGIGAFAFWGFNIADRTIIAARLSFKELGLYTYAIGFIMMGWNFFADFGRVLAPMLWAHSGKVDNIRNAFSDMKRISIYLSLATCMIIPFAQLGFYLLVKLITTKYVESISIFYILSYNLYLASIVIIPNLILTSKIVNKQKIVTSIYLCGVALNVIFNLFIIHLGYGVIGVAGVTIAAQGLVTLFLFIFAGKYLFARAKEFIFFLPQLVVPFLVSIIFYFFHIYIG